MPDLFTREDNVLPLKAFLTRSIDQEWGTEEADKDLRYSPSFVDMGSIALRARLLAQPFAVKARQTGVPVTELPAEYLDEVIQMARESIRHVTAVLLEGKKVVIITEDKDQRYGYMFRPQLSWFV